MKKHLLSIIAMASFAAYGQYGNIPNGGLENWVNDTTSETPDNWATTESQQPGLGTIQKSSDAVDGQNSLYMETVQVGMDTVFGYAVLGGVGPSGPSSHVAYTDQVDSVTFWMKHSMGFNDSVTVLVSRVDNGVGTPVMELFKVGGTQSAWTRYAFPLATMTQDSILVGFASGNAFVNYSTPGSYVYIDDVRLTAVSGTPSLVPNNSFENWTASIVEEPDSLYTLNAWLAGTGQVPVNKTTDAYSGTYAATVETIQVGPDTVPGLLMNAPLIPGQMPQAVPYTAQPTNFRGAYKYSGIGADVGSITCAFYDGGVIVDQPTVSPTGTVGTYTTFNIPVNLTAAPDSMSFTVFSGSNPGSMIWVDDIALTGGDVGYQDLLSFESVNMYPNPADDVSYLQINVDRTTEARISLLSIEGRVVFDETTILQTGENNYQLDVSTLSPGTYVVNIQTGERIESRKLLVE